MITEQIKGFTFTGTLSFIETDEAVLYRAQKCLRRVLLEIRSAKEMGYGGLWTSFDPVWEYGLAEARAVMDDLRKMDYHVTFVGSCNFALNIWWND